MKRIAFISMCALLTLYGCIGESSDYRTSSTPSSSPHSQKWYEGGTLHKANMRTWKSSTDRNKLATCAEFAFALDNTLSLDQVREKATDLKICIDEGTEGIDAIDNDPVTTIAAMCMTLMDEQ
jgi:hypothetical protein